MLVRIEAYFRKWIHRLHWDAWMARLLRLPRQGAPVSPGLVMIQIDGLAHTQFNRAIRHGRMPFLARLSRRENYKIYKHYSGMPSNTPAVQGALFYGVKTCVPAFSFKNKTNQKISHMFDPECAGIIEKRLKELGPGLLEGGSAYGNIFTGGAKEAHFCAAAIGWGTLLKAINPLGMPLTILLNLHVFIRAIFLGLVEFVCAIADCFGGVVSGKNLWKELGFIPMRVVVCVFLREIITAGAKIDIARGLPIIHVNFAGYDEQAHHRGPTSGFAHWTLRGIDKSIEKIWKSARGSLQRDYDIFVYSDHGQEETLEYTKLYGETLQAAVNRVFKEKVPAGFGTVDPSYHVCSRASTLRNISEKILDPHAEEKNVPKEPESAVTAMGAVGHIYTSQNYSEEEKDKIATELVASAKIPIVLTKAEAGKVTAWNLDGKFSLPEQADRVLDPKHPFLKEVAEDLVHLCHHEEAGDFIVLGWKSGVRSVTFYSERGSHAGPGAEETVGFALLPVDALPHTFGEVVHTLDIREAAFRALDRGNDKAFWETTIAPQKSLRIMTYNVHGCMGRDGKISPHRIARIISRGYPDVVALQELSPGKEAEQAAIIGRKLAMSFQFHPVFDVKKGRCGNAIFSRYPVRLIRNGLLPRLNGNPMLEPRGALWVEILVDGKPVQVINTHFSLSATERMLQTEALLGRDWLGSIPNSEPTIICGDFNALSQSKICKRIMTQYKNCQFELENHKPYRTLPSFYPMGIVDHIFLKNGLKTIKVEVPRTQLECIASDHLPVIAEVEFVNASTERKEPTCAAN